MYADNAPQRHHAYVIVCGNEKGGSGKTTTAMHIIVSLLNSGFRVAAIDLDTRQLSLSRYLQNRHYWARKRGLELPMPRSHSLERGRSDSILDNENSELRRFSEILQEVESDTDFIVIDTPGHDSYLMRLAHSMADTLVTPLNDSYVDFDVLGRIDPQTAEVIEISHYANMVRDARRHRRSVDNGLLDWVVVRNRLSQLSSKNAGRMSESLKSLSMELGCRIADGISERIIFRELFPVGLTVLDEQHASGRDAVPTISHMAARQEVRGLIATLRLPIDDIGRRRADARRRWMQASASPIEELKIFAD